MNAWRNALFLLLTCSAPLAEAAAAELRPFSASYALTWSGMSAGTAQLELQRLSDGRWSYQQRTAARGLFKLARPGEASSRSIFTIQNDHVVPSQFSADDGATSNAKDIKLDFDWVRGRVTGVAERKRVDLPTQPGLLDEMSVQVAVMHELLAGRTPTRFVLVDNDKIKDYNYATEGTETLRTEVGEHRTVIFRSSRPGSKKSTWFWCAPELGYLPLKVERRDGTDVQWFMTVKTLTIDDPAP
jgi:hypothetical protein